jgi:hypothetical protein
MSLEISFNINSDEDIIFNIKEFMTISKALEKIKIIINHSSLKLL